LLILQQFELEKTPSVFVQPHFLFVEPPFPLDLRLDVEQLPHLDLELPRFFLEGSPFEIEMWRFAGAKGAKPPRSGPDALALPLGGQQRTPFELQWPQYEFARAPSVLGGDPRERQRLRHDEEGERDAAARARDDHGIYA
jgi:hypothetical protein